MGISRIKQQTLPLKKNSDFRMVYNRGRSVADACMVVFVLKNGVGQSRLGISCSKKIGKAVVRNRQRRRIKELYRKTYAQTIRQGFDIIIMPRAAIVSAGAQDIEMSMRNLFKKQRLL